MIFSSRHPERPIRDTVRSGVGTQATLRLIIVAGLGLCLVGSLAWRSTIPSTAALLSLGQRQLHKGDYEAAESLAQQILERSPGHAHASLLAAQCALKLHDADRAYDYISTVLVTDDCPAEFLAFAADLCHLHVYRFKQAESFYLAWLQRTPDEIQALEGIAQLYAVCGRRADAIPFILKLTQLNHATDLLIVLARESGAINDLILLQKATAAEPDAAGPLLGLARHADSEHQLDKAIRLARQAVQLQPELMAAHAELGKYLWQQQSDKELQAWLKSLPKLTHRNADIQRIRGLLLVKAGRRIEALDAFLSSAQTALDSRETNFQISQLLFAANDPATAQLFVDRMNQIQLLQELQDRVIFSGNSATEQNLLEMIEAYQASGRIIEAYGWTQLSLEAYPNSQSIFNLRVRLAQQCADVPLRLVQSQLDLVVLENFAKYRAALPDQLNSSAESVRSPSAGLGQVSFVEHGDDVGLRFRFVNGSDQGNTRRMFEYTGGGVGAIDLDHDAWPDLVLTQGGYWDLRGADTNLADAVFRNRLGMQYSDVTLATGFRGFEFAQGVSVGDCNSDGFADILIAAIGCSRLWLNNGDGTFAECGHVASQLNSEDTWRTSCVMADVNGDSLPDLYLVGYLTGNDVYNYTCKDSKNRPRVCAPTQFDAVPDLCLLNDGAGGFRDAGDFIANTTAGKGLGVVVFAPTAESAASVYVANDTTSNFFYTRNRNSVEPLLDSGFSCGLAVSYDGKPEGSMGIAVGDHDDDGDQDLVVTNFLNEGTALYTQTTPGLFRDERVSADLLASSLSVLGFGTQFLDADLDGKQELFVANGHIDDLSDQGKPYQMQAQLIRFIDGQCRVESARDVGPYFQRDHLGRAVARLDWNRDGRPDLVVGHLMESTSLLENTSAVGGHWLQIRLIGTTSDRDAVTTEATLHVQRGSESFVQQLTAGDGYQCSNEKLIMFGTGGKDTAEGLSIRWPSGDVQEFQDVRLSRRLAIVEGRATLFVVPE